MGTNSIVLKSDLIKDRIVEALSADKDLNSQNNFKWPCSICNKNVTDSMKGIRCDSCKKWCHIRCDGTSAEEYEYLVLNEDTSGDWHCLYCTMKSNHANFAFTLIRDDEIDKINNSDSMRFCEFLPSLECIAETDKFSNMLLNNDNDFDQNISCKVSCKYHSVNAFQQMNIHNNLNIFHANVNGLESKFDSLQDFLAGSSAALDIIAITETSEQNDNFFISDVSLEGYTSFYTPTNSRNGGTAIYANSDYAPFERFDLKIQNDLFESVWVEIANENSKNILCGCIYRHPNYDLTDFFSYMEFALKTVAKEGKEVYLCGDFNVDLLKLDENNKYLEYFNLLSSYGFLPLIIHPTRVVEYQEPSLIDNIFSNNITDEILSGNIYFTLSEHFSQFASIKREKLDIRKVNLYERDYSKYSETDFHDDVSIQNWNLENGDSSVLFSDFYLKLKGCVDRHAPIKKLNAKELKLRSKPWIKSDLAKMIQIKNKLFERKKRQPSNLNIKILYNKFRNRVDRELKKAKKSHYTEYFSTHSSNIRKIWQGIRSIVNVKNKVNQGLSQLNINGKLIAEPKDIANHINDFFVNVGPNLDKNIPKINHVNANKYLKNRNQFNLIIAHISNDEIIKLIQSLPNKGTGPASIPLKMLKSAIDILVVPLCHIVNLSFKTGVFPDLLKVAKVIPLHKGGSTLDPNNFRPISLFSIFDKIIENLCINGCMNF